MFGMGVVGVVVAAPAEEPADVGRFVVVAGSGDSAGALAEVQLRWEAEGLFRADGWPRVVTRAELGATDAAAASFVAAEVRDRLVAERIVKYLSGRGYDARVLSTSGTGPDRRVIWADSVSVSGNGAPLFAYDVCVLAGDAVAPTPTGKRGRPPPPPPCVAQARPDPQFGGWFVVVPRLAEELSVWADAGEPWSCRAVPLGPVPDRPVWLHGPVTVTCLAPPVEVPSR